VRIWQQEVMSIAFHQTAQNSAGIIFQFGIFIRLRALSPFVGSGSKGEKLNASIRFPLFTQQRT
jgi:hypothetical protein